MKKIRGLMCVLCGLVFAAAVFMAGNEAKAQCSVFGGCRHVTAVEVQVHSPAAVVQLPAAGVEACGAMDGPYLVAGRPLANIGKRFLFRLRHPFAPVFRR